MTYSICATEDGVHGIAIATKAPAVGSLAPFLSKNGAVCTQAYVNAQLGVKAARLLDNDCSVDVAIKNLVDKDPDKAVRQIHGVDNWGNSHIFSGNNCEEWFGGIEGANFTVAGNMLVDEKVLNEMAEEFESLESSLPISERLLGALKAGEAAGGDKRGENAQSAALKIYREYEPKLTDDLRIDDHERPVNKLEELYHKAEDVWTEWEKRSANIILK